SPAGARGGSQKPASAAAGGCSAPCFITLQSESHGNRLRRSPWPDASAADLRELLAEFRQGSEEIGDEAVVGHLENGGLLVLVDGDDDLGVLHAGKVLDG